MFGISIGDQASSFPLVPRHVLSPPEILDLIVDNLHADTETLKTCCLVSKAWIHRTRKYLFNSIQFQWWTARQWRADFPDPLSSPAHHARILSIAPGTDFTSDANINTLRTFCSVSCLEVDTVNKDYRRFTLVPLHGFCPMLKSFCLSFSNLTSSEIFGLICSFPILQDFMPIGYSTSRLDSGAWNTPSTSPQLTGSLVLHVAEGIRHFTSQLLDLPNGVHFKRIVVDGGFQKMSNQQ